MEHILMPQLGETVTEGTVVRWLKREGEPIQADEALFDVSTDKVDAEVPSAFGGVVRALLVAEGDTVPIGTPVAVIGSADESVVDDRPTGPNGSAAGLEEVSSASSLVDRTAAPVRPSRPDPVAAAPRGGDPAVAGDPASAPAPADRRDRRAGGSGFVSPVVRRLLEDLDLDVQGDRVVGSGRDGRVTRADVLAAAAARDAADGGGPNRRGAVGGATRVRMVEPVQPGEGDEVVPFSGARRTTAAAMKSSRATAAHAVVTTEIDYLNVEAVRRDAGLTYLPFVARATIDALADFAHLNASIGDDCLVVHREVHLGIAVDLEYEALVVPVVKEAAGLRLAALASRIAELAEKARTRRLALDELEGATFTITNVGSYGTVASAPIIMQPQLAVLSTDGVRMRPVARPGSNGEWAVAVHPVGNLSLSFDHRGVDGAYVAAFLARVRDLLETRRWGEELGS